MSGFVVSARKYRPKRFEDVIGQNHIAKTLKNALQQDKLAHAFLFCGPRGVGKTTCARILAKVINCQNPINKVEPCNECSSCKSFNENASFNILELDAASNNSVDHIRTLIEQVRFQPQQGSHKVFIIDEVHMLSQQAFNAFLKTLEEPPPYAIFILATTEKHKILPTILSRCQIFDFKRIQPKDVVEQLEYILKEEGKTADIEALHQIGMKADGAMRDALSIFDKIASATNGHITYKDVVSNLNILDYEHFFAVTDAILRSDLKSILLTLDEIIKNGFEPEQFLDGLSEHFRNLLLSKDPETAMLMACSDELKQRYHNQALLCQENMILSGLNILNQCDVSLPRANNKRLYIEVALSKIAYINHLKDGTIFGDTLDSEEKKNLNEKPIVEPIHQENSQQQPVSSTIYKIKEPDSSKQGLGIGKSQEPKIEEIKVEPTIASEVQNPISSSVSENDAKRIVRSGRIKIEDLRQQIAAESSSKKSANDNFDLENVKRIWLDHKDNHHSPMVKNAMQHTELSIEDKTIKVFVPNTSTKNIILQEQYLMEKLREEFHMNDLTLAIQIDIEKFPGFEEVVVKKPKSKSELYQEIVQANPLIAKLVEEHNFKVE